MSTIRWVQVVPHFANVPITMSPSRGSNLFQRRLSDTGVWTTCAGARTNSAISMPPQASRDYIEFEHNASEESPCGEIPSTHFTYFAFMRSSPGARRSASGRPNFLSLSDGKWVTRTGYCRPGDDGRRCVNVVAHKPRLRGAFGQGNSTAL